MLISKQFELTSLCVCMLKNGAYCLFSLGPIPPAFTSRHRGDINGSTFGSRGKKNLLNSTFGHPLCMGFCWPLQMDEIIAGLGPALMREVSEAEIFVSVMKWQSPNFIKAKCSCPSTIVHSLYFWKAFIVLINVKEFCGEMLQNLWSLCTI